ncbi:hypothetical protein Pint_13517 [Pistacia integerrima]|uniref:Uncharacterized protein n=1 Tax=Pistacia integerrima TaxID=434235 RepID=A0ACC0Y4U6_9ROSI|nr:hypothetical protein Pint_13517 [Pistacia integerrima]
MAAHSGSASSVPSLPPPRPKSPPEYPDLYGKRREMARVQVLEREIGFLEEELKSVEGLHPASRCCKEVADFTVANADPFIPLSLFQAETGRIGGHGTSGSGFVEGRVLTSLGFLGYAVAVILERPHAAETVVSVGFLRARIALVAQAAPLVAQTALLVVQTAPLVAQTAPLVSRTAHAAQSAPLVARTAHVAQTAPLVAQTVHVTRSAPLVAQTVHVARSAPLVAQTVHVARIAPLVARTGPVAQLAHVYRIAHVA